MTLPLKLNYSDKLNKLERQYERLLVNKLFTSSFDFKMIPLEV